MTRRPALGVGDRALLRYGREEVEVEVIEDRGLIGVGGRRLLRIRMLVTASDAVEMEVAEIDLCRTTRAA
jgi:hypothetical protein